MYEWRIEDEGIDIGLSANDESRRESPPESSATIGSRSVDRRTSPWPPRARVSDIVLSEELPPDGELISSLRAGIVHAFDLIYTRHYAAVWKFACRFTASHDEAHDITQDVFVSIWERRTELAVEGSLRTYLLAAVRFRGLDALRRRYTEKRSVAELAQMANAGEGPAADISSTFRSAEDALDERLLQSAIYDALRQLPERQRSAILLRWEQGLTNQEITEVLGIGKAAVSRLLHRAVQTLRTLITERS